MIDLRYMESKEIKGTTWWMNHTKVVGIFYCLGTPHVQHMGHSWYWVVSRLTNEGNQSNKCLLNI